MFLASSGPERAQGGPRSGCPKAGGFLCFFMTFLTFARPARFYIFYMVFSRARGQEGPDGPRPAKGRLVHGALCIMGGALSSQKSRKILDCFQGFYISYPSLLMDRVVFILFAGPSKNWFLHFCFQNVTFYKTGFFSGARSGFHVS